MKTYKNCDYWGTYQGCNIYKYYGKGQPESSKTDVFAMPNGDLILDDVVIGKVDMKKGVVYNWHPELINKKEKSNGKTSPVVMVDELPTVATINVDEVLEKAFKRTLDELIGDKLAKY